VLMMDKMTNIVMKYVFIIQLVSFIILIISSRKKFREEADVLKGDQRVVRILVSAGLLLLQIIKHKYNSGYERKLEAKMRQLETSVHSHTMLRIHIAKKVMAIFLCILFLLYIGWQAGITAEYIVFSILLIIVVFYISDKQIDNKIKQRRMEIQREFPEFLNKLVILINAGLTVSAAINKVVRDSKGTGELFKELNRTMHDISAGKPELQSYEDFASRCRMADISMFVTMLAQNLRKGSSELVPILRIQAMTCWENRKNAARKLGEEASAKLLIPMVMIFTAILIMVMAPAIMQMKIF
jgi:tight adherence protein C